MTLPTPASVTLPVPGTLTAALTMAVSARGTACPAGGSVGEDSRLFGTGHFHILCFVSEPTMTPHCHASAMTSVLSMETAAQTMLKSVTEEVEVVCLTKT